MPIWYSTAIWVTALFATSVWAQSVIPDSSLMHQNSRDLQRVLVSPLGAGTSVTTAGWQMGSLTSQPAENFTAKVGRQALLFSGDAKVVGAKGDFIVGVKPPTKPMMIGFWALPVENVLSVGLQVTDAEGESLLLKTDVAGKQWTWIDCPISDFKQSYKQDGKNGNVDFPLRDVHVIWFARGVGKTSVAVNALSALVPAEDNGSLSLSVESSSVAESGMKATVELVLTNFQNAPLNVTFENTIQEDSSLYEESSSDRNSAAVIPSLGKSVGRSQRTIKIGSRSFETLAFSSDVPLESGAFLASMRVQAGGHVQIKHQSIFVMPPEIAMNADSRFGINSSDASMAPALRRLGVGWVRFENMKWDFISPAPHQYAYDGSVKPWIVRHDEIVQAYRQEGIQVLPYLFHCAPWASSAVGNQTKRYAAYPPRDFADYGEFVFQTVARYGSTLVPAQELKTQDKKTGLNLVNTFELWNEPNLNDPGWGPWVSTFPHFLEMFRVGAEAARKADPTCIISTPGLAGVQLRVIDQLRTHRYSDGKTALDFADVLNAHFYTGAIAPEIATEDTNLNRHRTGDGQSKVEDDLQRLNEWRNKYKPGMPIWITETGFDTGGPRVVSERTQAAWIPRDIMLALACGMDKVFLYRDTGSGNQLFAASGVVRNDRSYKPSFFTYATLIRQLDGVKSVRRIACSDSNIRIYEWMKKDNRRVISAWAIKGTAKLESLSALLPGQALNDVTMTDSFGRTTKRTNTANMELTEFPVYIQQK